jgi:hypothetical protein
MPGLITVKYSRMWHLAWSSLKFSSEHNPTKKIRTTCREIATMHKHRRIWYPQSHWIVTRGPKWYVHLLNHLCAHYPILFHAYNGLWESQPGPGMQHAVSTQLITSLHLWLLVCSWSMGQKARKWAIPLCPSVDNADRQSIHCAMPWPWRRSMTMNYAQKSRA